MAKKKATKKQNQHTNPTTKESKRVHINNDVPATGPKTQYVYPQSAGAEPSPHVASVGEAPGTDAQKGWIRRNPLATGGILVAAAICGAMAVGFYTTNANMEAAISAAQDAISVRQTVAETAHADLAQQVEDMHVHNWQADTVLVHHDAVTHDVLHPATYETVAVNHTVCNECHENIDGKTDEHYAETGHKGYTTNVPIPETRIATAEWTETIIDAEAYDELVTETETCSSCGEVREVEVGESVE